MNKASTPLRLLLLVENPQVLQQGSAPRCSFDANGGTIGSKASNWLLHDNAGRVHPCHCEIRHEDGGYLIIDRCGETRVNDQTRPLGRDTGARLRHLDTLHIGPYRVRVQLDDEQHHLPDQGRTLTEHDPGELLGQSRDSLDARADDAPHELPANAPQPSGWGALQAQEDPAPPQGLLDPLKALDAAHGLSTLQQEAEAGLDPRHYGHTPLAAQSDVSTTPFEAVHGAPMHVPGEPRMLEHTHPNPAASQWLEKQLADGRDPATMVAPLVQGMEAQVGALDGPTAYALLHEAGRTLGALIRGLSALHTENPGGQQRISLAGRTLQPIEDNPLRLGQSYPETVRALFSAQRSRVHLAPAAAVQESLEQLQRQQIAMHQAITAGLRTLLQALSPEQLQQRFLRYSGTQAGLPPGDDWAWRMYGHYYDELSSDRQQGFEKLFWEVFEQVFDQALRTEA